MNTFASNNNLKTYSVTILLNYYLKKNKIKSTTVKKQ